MGAMLIVKRVTLARWGIDNPERVVVADGWWMESEVGDAKECRMLLSKVRGEIEREIVYYYHEHNKE